MTEPADLDMPFMPRPLAARPGARAARESAPQVSPNALAHAARDAVLDVLPADWQKLPDGTNTANALAGTLANHYAARQRAQAERLAAASEGTEDRDA